MCFQAADKLDAEAVGALGGSEPVDHAELAAGGDVADLIEQCAVVAGERVVMRFLIWDNEVSTTFVLLRG